MASRDVNRKTTTKNATVATATSRRKDISALSFRFTEVVPCHIICLTSNGIFKNPNAIIIYIFLYTGYSPMFRKLFKYITGENEDKAKIKMTAPVLVSVKNMKDSETCRVNMGFFIPPAESATIPAPTRDDVTIGQMSPMCVYVLSYGGWQMSLNSKFHNKVNELKADLKKAGVEDFDETAGPMFAGYDSPWRLFNRHNEIMLLKKKPE